MSARLNTDLLEIVEQPTPGQHLVAVLMRPAYERRVRLVMVTADSFVRAGGLLLPMTAVAKGRA